NLAALYQYFRERLVQANVKKDPEILKEILPMITDLRDAFFEANKLVK
ncbi:MAG: flagellar protein FliS, partial [Oscillospiraceae bacterium]|nr:flagellar protein FliS [Oscillospiraceae bacterium]